MSSAWLPGVAGAASRPPGRAGAGGGRPDLIGRDSTTDRLNHKWYGDGTEIPTEEGKLYLDSVLDMGSRRIVGFGLGEHHDTDLATAALQMAVAVRGGKDAIREVIMHSDQGSEGRSRSLPREDMTSPASRSCLSGRLAIPSASGGPAGWSCRSTRLMALCVRDDGRRPNLADLRH